MRVVTIIVPVYGDWPSLSDCIDSLKKYVDKRHKIMLVNDYGPDRKDIEKRTLKAIKFFTNFEYYANKENLGFLQNCNNAVLNLDKTTNDILLLNSDTKVTEGFLEELIEVAYLSDKHGTVCPRSSDATIASIPLNPRNQGEVMTPDDSCAIYRAIKNDLPRYSVSPVSVGFCFYVKRSVIDEIGLFDEVFGKGYGEEDDFCMRINKKGYISVIANKSFVYHMSARSFTPERRSELISVNAKILEQRHPLFNTLVRNYLEYNTTFAEVFGETILTNKTAVGRKNIKVLINLHSLPASEVSDTDSIRRILRTIKRDKNTQYTVATSAATRDFLAINNKALTYCEPHTINEQFDLGVSLFSTRDINDLVFLQRTCARFVVTSDVFNLIYNNNYKISGDQTSIASAMIRWSDVVISENIKLEAEVRAYSGVVGLPLSIKSYADLGDFFEPSNIRTIVADHPIDIKHANQRWSDINSLKAMKEVPIHQIVKNVNIIDRLNRKVRTSLFSLGSK